MEEKNNFTTKYTTNGALLGFIGGGLDVFCHMHYRSLVATQTGNLSCFSSLIGTDPRVENTIMRFSSILFFSIGFCGCPPYQRVSQDSLWRTKMLIPLFVVTLLIPLVSVIPPVEVPFIAFWDRDDDVDLYREPHRKSTLTWSLWLPAITARCWRPCTESYSREREIWTSIGVRPWITESSLEVLLQELLASPSSCISFTNGPSGWSQSLTHYTPESNNSACKQIIYRNRTPCEVLF